MGFLDQLVGKVARAAQVKIENATVGKVEGKIGSAQANLQQKILRGMDKAFDKAGDAVKGKTGAAARDDERDT